MKEHYALLKSAAAGLGFVLARDVELIGVKWRYAVTHKRTQEKHTFSKIRDVATFLENRAP